MPNWASTRTLNSYRTNSSQVPNFNWFIHAHSILCTIYSWDICLNVIYTCVVLWSLYQFFLLFLDWTNKISWLLLTSAIKRTAFWFFSIFFFKIIDRRYQFYHLHKIFFSSRPLLTFTGPRLQAQLSSVIFFSLKNKSVTFNDPFNLPIESIRI